VGAVNWYGSGPVPMVITPLPMWTFIRTVDADGIHGGRHLIAGNLRRLWRVPTPTPARMVAFVGVNLSI
jgi:hypothetical protein